MSGCKNASGKINVVNVYHSLFYPCGH